MDRPKRGIPSLDGLRAVSIGLVIVGHYFSGIYKQTTPLTPSWSVFGNDGLGVTVFFVLSGFLITSLLLSEFTRAHNINIKEFYRRRFYRIFPPFYAYVFFVGILGLFSIVPLTRADLLGTLFYVWNYSPFVHSWTLEHCWSLCVEEQFYLLWPTLLLFSLKRGGRRWAAYVAVALIAIAPVLRFATNQTHNAFLIHRIPQMLHTRMDALMIGCATSLVWGSTGLEKAYQFLRRPIYVFPLFAFVVTPLVQFYFDPSHQLGGYTLQLVCIALSMVWLIKEPDSLVGRVLNTKIMKHVGVVSYSLYLWQHIFLHPNNHSVFGRAPLNLILIFGCAELSYWTIERYSYVLRDRGKKKNTSHPLAEPSLASSTHT